MAVIDIGSGAANYNTGASVTLGLLDKTNPANATGTIDTIELYFITVGADIKSGTLYGSGTSYTSRDYATIGAVTQGSKQTFSGLDVDAETGDFIGVYGTAGNIEASDSGGADVYYKSGSGEMFTGSAITFIKWGTARRLGLYATGTTPVAPTVTTSAATSVTSSSCQGNGEITATGGANATRRGFCYKAGTSGDPTTADSVVYDDGDYGTGTFSKAITGLSAETTYRVRAYAVNAGGTGYGDTVTVETLAVINAILSIDVLSEATADGIAPVDITEGQGITLTIDALAEALAEGIIPSNITAGTGITLSIDVLAEAAAAGIPCIFAGYWDLPHKLKLTASNNRTLVLKASNNRDLVLKAENNRTLVLKARD